VRILLRYCGSGSGSRGIDRTEAIRFGLSASAPKANAQDVEIAGELHVARTPTHRWLWSPENERWVVTESLTGRYQRRGLEQDGFENRGFYLTQWEYSKLFWSLFPTESQQNIVRTMACPLPRFLSCKRASVARRGCCLITEKKIGR
jgi:hypothetical protein